MSNPEVDSTWLEKYWRHPYHLHMKTKMLQTVVGESKYDRIFGPYTYHPKPRQKDYMGPIRSLIHNQNKPIQNNKEKSRGEIRKLTTKGFHSNTADHSCTDCADDVGHKKFKLKAPKCKIFVPDKDCFIPVHNIFKAAQKGKQSNLLQDKNKLTDLKSWIFTPTHERCLLGNINFTHNMVDEETKYPKSFIHVLVVQRTQFKEYVKCWGSSHVIIQLPDSMPGIGIPAEIGRVGYARRFIQLFAEKLGLKTVFLVDDNIPYLYDIKTTKIHGGETTVEVKDGEIQRKNVPLYTVLKHIESQFNGTNNSPVQLFEPHKDAKQENKNKLEGYTGPSSKYGIIGILRKGRFTSEVCHPFRNTHVFGISFLNIEALKEHGIKYEPWPVWEDLTLNNDCDQSGLFVVKYNRFLFMKRHIPSGLPDVYVWNEETDLQKEQDVKNNADRSVEILINHIQSWAPPKSCRECPDGENSAFPEMKSMHQKIAQKIKESEIHESVLHRHHIVFFYPGENLQLVSNYLKQTTGLGHFSRLIMVFPIEACHKFKLTTVRDFKTKIVDGNFTNEDGNTEPLFQVFTSHNPYNFKVKMVLVYVEGKGE